MDRALAARFVALWTEHFPATELPIAFFFSDVPTAPVAPPTEGWRCFFTSLAAVRDGVPLAFDSESIGCEGGKRYLGFVQGPAPGIELFLSCGTPGGREPLRLKRSPGLVRASQASGPHVVATGRYLVAKRWDRLDDADEPEVVTFFARADAVAGLVALASFDRADDDGTACPAVAGCASAFALAYAERNAAAPRCFVGLFDFTPRQYVDAGELTFSVPYPRFRTLVEELPRTFVKASGWRKVIRRGGFAHAP